MRNATLESRPSGADEAARRDEIVHDAVAAFTGWVRDNQLQPAQVTTQTYLDWIADPRRDAFSYFDHRLCVSVATALQVSSFTGIRAPLEPEYSKAMKAWMYAKHPFRNVV